MQTGAFKMLQAIISESSIRWIKNMLRQKLC